MASDATAILNSNTNNCYVVSIFQNICHQFSYNNNGLLLKNRIMLIRDNFTAVNRFYLKENYVECGNAFSSDVQQENNENVSLTDMRLIASMRLELLRKMMTKQSIREKLDMWQKKKNEMLQNTKFDIPLKPTFRHKAILFEKENYKLILNQIQKRTNTEQVLINYQQRSREIYFKGLLAKTNLTVSILDNHFNDLKLVSIIGGKINVYHSMKSKLYFFKNVNVVEETTLTAMKNLLNDLTLYKNNVIIPIQTELQAIAMKNVNKKSTLKHFSVNIPEKKTIKHARQHYVSLVKNNEKIVKNVINVEKLSFTNDPTTKIFRQNLIKIINTIVNTISSTNETHLTNKYNKLNELLSGKFVSMANTQVIIGDNEEALAFCMETLATKIINYAEQIISVKTEVAYDVAIIIVKLISVHQQFGKIFFAKIKQKCPLLVPFNLPVAKCLTSEQKLNYKSLGYKFDTCGKIESHEKYLKRMIGIVRLYAALIVTSLKYERPVIGISQAWIFVSGTLNQYPVADITTTMLLEFLTIAGFAMNQNYGIQFIKLLQYINTHYMKKIIMVTPAGFGGSISRLNNFLSKSLLNGSIREPKGMLSSNYL